jgi:ribosomal protein L7/L12
MAQVTKETLIGALHTNPTNDKEIGYNSAIIWILKMLIDSVDGVTPRDVAVLKSAFDFHSYAGFNALTPKNIATIIENAKSGNKLMICKEIREATGLPLRESKDVADRLYDLIKP